MQAPLMNSRQQSPSRLWHLGTGRVMRLDIGPGPRHLRLHEGRLWLTGELRTRRSAAGLRVYGAGRRRLIAVPGAGRLRFASRAHGSISAGDSVASSGAVQ